MTAPLDDRLKAALLLVASFGLIVAAVAAVAVAFR